MLKAHFHVSPVSEAYSEKVLSISENPFESFEEREVSSISMVETDVDMQEPRSEAADQLPRVTGVQQLSAADDSTSDVRRSELETIEEEPAAPVVKQATSENLSSSFTSSNSSYYETALGLNNADGESYSALMAANYSNNSEGMSLCSAHLLKLLNQVCQRNCERKRKDQNFEPASRLVSLHTLHV